MKLRNPMARALECKIFRAKVVPNKKLALKLGKIKHKRKQWTTND